MSSYKDSQQTELEGYKLIKPYLEQVSFQGRYVIAKTGSKNIITNQLLGQDIFIQVDKNHNTITADMKAVEGSYDRLFLETLSNKKTKKPGCLIVDEVDIWLYLMLGSAALSAIHFPSLKRWCDNNLLQNDYIFCKQQKCDQLNDSWGYLVPKRDLLVLGPQYCEIDILDPNTYKLPLCL